MVSNVEPKWSPPEEYSWICPDLTAYWQLAKVKNSDQILLKAEGTQHLFSPIEGYALRYFTGQFTVGQVQQRCQQQFKQVSPNLVIELLQKLITLGILAPDAEEMPTPSHSNPRLKAGVHWIAHPDGYWLLRNPEDVTFLQVSDRDKVIIDQFNQFSPHQISQAYDITPDELRFLLRLLAATAMLEGTKPQKPPKRKFTPLQLLYFKVRLFNPDPWLTQSIPALRWIWTRFFAIGLCFFLAYSATIGFSHQAEILHTGQLLWQHEGASLIIPFGLLTAFVVTLHELGHAFTLKHYGGIVPEVGFLFMFLMPAAYTNTTDSYCLSRFRRILVVAAGVLVQLTLAAIAFWLWSTTASGVWLHTASYLLMLAALFTVALNLNPLAKFDGYYLAVALTGINNLRSRSFQFYSNLFSLQPIQEKPSDRFILAAYAPFSFLYIQFVFGFLLYRVTDWTLTHLPTTAALLLGLWAIYYFFPSSK